MAITAETIGVEIVTKMNQLDTGLKTAESKVDRSAEKMSRSINGIGRISGVSRFGRGLMTGFGVASVAVAATHLAGTGFAAMDFFTAKIDGNARKAAAAFERLNESIQNLPFGIGRLYESMQGAVNEGYGRDWKAFGLSLAHAGSGQFGIAGTEMSKFMHSGSLAEQMRQDAIDAQNKKIRDAGSDMQMELQNRTSVLQKRLMGDEIGAAAAEIWIEKMKRIDAANAFGSAMRSEDYNQLIATIEGLADAELEMRKQQLSSKATFDTFNTVLGAFKSPNRARIETPASEDTAKKTADNTAKTAAILQELKNKGGAIIAFA